MKSGLRWSVLPTALLFTALAATAAQGSNGPVTGSGGVHHPPLAPGAFNTVANAPNDAYGGAAASDGTYVYWGGGYSFASAGNVTNFSRYDPVTNAWTSLAALPDTDNSMASAVYSPINGKLYLFGGEEVNTATVVSTTRVYDPVANTWSTATAMPDVRAFAAGVYYNGKIYIIGGYNSGNVDPSFGQVWQYDPVADSWDTSRTAMPDTLGGAGYGVIDGNIIIAGGRNLANPNLSSVYSYNIATDTWSTKSSLPSGINVPASAAIDGQLWVIGGGNPFAGSVAADPGPGNAPSTTGATQIYDPIADAWSAGPSLNVGRSFVGGTNLAGSAYAIGGYNGATTVPTTEVSLNPVCGSGVSNGGFESGDLTSWTVDGVNNPPTADTGQADDGTFSALLGNVSGPEPTGDSALYQTVTVPASGGVLSFWTWTYTVDSITFDWQDAYIEDTSGNILATLFHQCNNDQAWVNRTFDMSAFAGQTVRIRFLVHQDGFGDDTAMYVDNVRLLQTAPVNAFANPGFETGDLSAWNIDGTNSTPVISNAQIHTGSWSALLGNVAGPEPTGDSSMYQTIHVPASGGTLSFWNWTYTVDSITFDWQDAYIEDTSGNILATIFHQCSNNQAWVQTTLDMSPYAGQTVRVRFLVHEDGFGDDTGMYVDDVVLLTPPSRNILIVSADSGVIPATLQCEALSQPGIASVDVYPNADTATPQLGEIERYDEAVFFSNTGYADQTTLGNEAADYLDAGGRVFALNFDWYGGTQSLEGRWQTGGYSPFQDLAPLNFVNGSLGTYDATSPLMAGVAALNSFFRSSPTLSAGTTLIASWSDATALLAARCLAVGASGYVGDFSGNFSGDWGRVAANIAFMPPALAAPTITPSGPTTFCQGGSVTLDAGAGYTTYLWSPGGQTTQTIVANASGSYTVTISNASGCTASSAPVVVTVNPLPTPSITPSGPTTFCAGGSVTLDAGAGYSAYLWSPGGATTETIAVGTSGSYSVTVTDGNGCQGTSAPVVVTVNPLPTPSITPSGPTTFCAGGSVTLDAGAGYAAYLWSPGGATTQTIAVSTSGSYSVTVTDGNGCQGTSAPTTVTVNPAPAPTITVSHCLTPNTSGQTASVPANAGDTYNWTITGGTIDSGQGTDTISFTSGGPATLMTLNVTETTVAGCTGNAGDSMQVNFNDVPASNPFYTFICTIARHAITAGCGGGNFCPANLVLRSQMAVFLLRGEHGSVYVPPPAVGIFGDVPASNPFAPWIEELYNEQITGGCSTNPLLYCPNNDVSRAGMAVFLLVAEHGTGYVPPACVGIFTDVACPGPFTNWIEQLYSEGVTGGCNTNPLMYCPGNFVTRAQMAVFLTATFNLP